MSEPEPFTADDIEYWRGQTVKRDVDPDLAWADKDVVRLVERWIATVAQARADHGLREALDVWHGLPAIEGADGYTPHILGAERMAAAIAAALAAAEAAPPSDPVPLYLENTLPRRTFNLRNEADFEWLAGYFSGYHGVPGLRAAAEAAPLDEVKAAFDRWLHSAPTGPLSQADETLITEVQSALAATSREGEG